MSTTHNPLVGRRFFGQFGSICALCVMLGTVEAAQAQAKPASPSKQAAKGGGKAPPGAGAGSSAASEDSVKVTDFGSVDIAVEDTQLADVLEMLAIHSQKNIIVNKNVSASVTAYLYDVTFNEALDAILRPNGYGYLEQGNFIYIYTLDELEEIRKKSLKTESRIFELDHLSADDAKAFITPLLSADGKAEFRGQVAKGFEPRIADGGADDYAYNTKLVVNDYADNLEHIAALLTDLDTPPKQVLVEATILQTAVNEANAFGVDFSIISDINFLDLTNPLSPVTNLLNGSDATNGFQPADNKAFGTQSTVGQAQGPGGLKIGIINDDVSVFVRVLDEVTDTTVLARPKVMALNRQRAQVLVGAKVGYLSTTSTDTTTTQTVEFLDTGIKLVFRPFISRDGSIRMELAPSVSEASLRNVTDVSGLQVTIPDQLTNEITTNVRVKDGQTLVLGGLFKESNRINRRQIPWIGDVPILGLPFRGQDDTVRKDEIIFLITPTVIPDDVLWKAGEDANSMMDTARVGMRAGLLPWSRDQMTTNHALNAIEAYNNGEIELAKYYVNTSLRLNPNQIELLKFRQQIEQATPDPTHERSVLERAWHPERAGTTGGPQSRGPAPGTTPGTTAGYTSSDRTPLGAADPGTATGSSPDFSDSGGSQNFAGSGGAAEPFSGSSETPGSSTASDASYAAVVEVFDPTRPNSGSHDSSLTANGQASVTAVTGAYTPTPLPDLGFAGGNETNSSSAATAMALTPQQQQAFDHIMDLLFVQWRVANGLPPIDADAFELYCRPISHDSSELAGVPTETSAPR